MAGHSIWIHAVSVGEVMAVVDLVRMIQERAPTDKIIISTVTQTGQALAKQKFQDVTVIYAPLDFSWVVRRYVKLIDPGLYIAAETEIWPNLYQHLKQRHTPIIQVNGRISDKAFKGYQKFRPFMRPALDAVSVFCMQSQTDAERIIALGAVPERVQVVGNLKFDKSYSAISVSKEDWFFSAQEMIFVAGSTHPGEEQIMLDAYKELLTEFPSLRLVIAPRHIERISEIEAMINENGYSTVRFSQCVKNADETKPVILVDTIGDLCKLYAIADVVFVGKTFTRKGGQNMIEPLFFGKPTFVGPNTQNFKSVVDILSREKVLCVVRSPATLSQPMKEVLRSPAKKREWQERTRRVIEKYQGATVKTYAVITQIILER